MNCVLEVENESDVVVEAANAMVHWHEATEETVIMEAGTMDWLEGEQMDLFPSELPRTTIVPKMLGEESEWTPANLDNWLSAEPPEMEFLFENIFPAGIAAGLCGAGGLGKSTFILQLSFSLATGMTVFPAFVPSKPQRVMIFLGEDPTTVTWQRFRYIEERFPLSPEQKCALIENLHVYSDRAKALCTLQTGKVCPTEAYKELQREVGRIRPMLLIIDPKSRWSAMNENSNDEATAFVELLEGLVRPYGTSVLITSHVSKAGKNSLGTVSVRGASALVDALRLVFSMVPKNTNGDEEGGHPILLHTLKNNFAPRLPQAIELRRCDKFGGVLEQVEDGCEILDLLGIAHTLSKWLAENGPINMSAIFDSRDDRAIELHQLLAEQCASFRKDIEKAIELGQEAGLLVVESVPTKGRPAKRIRSSK